MHDQDHKESLMKSTHDNQNTVIVLLMISASILTAFLLGGFVMQDRADADAPARSPDMVVSRPPNMYTMCTGAWDDTIDILYVLDINAQKLNAYVTNDKTEAIEQFDSISLPQAFRASTRR